MICYVNIEHERVINDPAQRVVHLSCRHDTQLRLEELSGDACLVQRYEKVSPAKLKEWNIRAVVISGNATDWEHYDEAKFAGIYQIIRSTEWPILGICGGCQLIAKAYGIPIGPIRLLHEGETSPSPTSIPGYYKEWGFKPVRVVKTDPLFDGLGPPPVFLEAHYWEVKELPAGWESLASTDETPVQVLKQIGYPVYGVQFHPEGYTEKADDRMNLLANLVYPDEIPPRAPDGKTLLTNFFKIAGVVK